MSYKKLSLEEWQEIGKKVKEIKKNNFELLELLNGKLPKKEHWKLWKSIDKSFGKLRSHLDDIVCGNFKDLPDREVVNIFYGKQEK